MTTVDILKAARKRLADPKMWRKGGGTGPEGETCLGLMLSDVGDVDYEAQHAVAHALGFPESAQACDVYDWNDDPATTHADVLATLDKTIAIEEAKVAA